MRRCSSPERAARERKFSRGFCTGVATGQRNRSSASIAPPSRRPCWNPSCLAMRKDPSPARSPAALASSRRRMAARSCSTKFPKWTYGCRRSCCARSRSESSIESAATAPSRLISVSSRRRTAISPKRFAMEDSERICCSALTSST